MSESEIESQWRLEFEMCGENEVRDALNRGESFGSAPRKKFAFLWLREKEKEKTVREQQTYLYVKWTLWAAIVAVLVGIVGIVVTLFH